MSFVRTHAILGMIDHPNVQKMTFEPVEIFAPTLLECKLTGAELEHVLDAIITVAMVLRSKRVWHGDFTLQNFKLVAGEPILCGFDKAILQDAPDYTQSVQACIAQFIDCGLSYKLALEAKSLQVIAQICDLKIIPMYVSRRLYRYIELDIWTFVDKEKFIDMLFGAELTDVMQSNYQLHIYNNYHRPLMINYLIRTAPDIRHVSDDWVPESVVGLPRMSECKFDVYQMFSVVAGITRAYAALDAWNIVHPFTADCFRIRNGCEPILCDFAGAYLSETDVDRQPMDALLKTIVGQAVPVIQPAIRIRYKDIPNNIWTQRLLKTFDEDSYQKLALLVIGSYMPKYDYFNITYDYYELEEHVSLMFSR